MALTYFSGKTNYTNNTTEYVLVLGWNLGNNMGDGNFAKVTDAAGNTIEWAQFKAFGTAASEVWAFSKRFIVPPGGQFSTQNPAFFGALQGTLEDLRGFI